ncbi:hypothetical protein HanOQP8_Chr10g0353071 [Helianthus annuus]|nr:hypothetical protein HanOQP8_Chr10g0353071 [Helianthus annuus]
MAMHSLSLSPATSSVRSVHQRPKITPKLRNRPTTLVSLQGNLLSWSSSVSYVKLNAVVGKTVSQKRQVYLQLNIIIIVN